MPYSRRSRNLLAAVPVFAGAVGLIGCTRRPPHGDPLIAGFKSTYAASVSDAVELVTGRPGTMTHDMKLMTGTNLVGRAVTSLVRPATAEQATAALSTRHSVEMIDEAKPGEIGVIVMEGTLDIAAMGNLMATAALERQMAGMVLDGAIRDMWDIRRMGLTVYARSKSPRTAVGHYATVARNVPVTALASLSGRATSSSLTRTASSSCPGSGGGRTQARAGDRRQRTRHVSIHPAVQVAARSDREVQSDLN